MNSLGKKSQEGEKILATDVKLTPPPLHPFFENVRKMSPCIYVLNVTTWK